MLWEIDRLQQILIMAEELCRHLERQPLPYLSDRMVRELLTILTHEPAIQWKRISDRKREASYPQEGRTTFNHLLGLDPHCRKSHRPPGSDDTEP